MVGRFLLCVCCHPSAACGAQRSSTPALLCNRLQLVTSQSGSTKLTVQLRTWEHSTPALGIDVRQVLQDYQVATQTAQLVVFGASACGTCVCVLYKLLDFCWSCGYWNDNTSDEAAKFEQRRKIHWNYRTGSRIPFLIKYFFVSFQQ